MEPIAASPLLAAYISRTNYVPEAPPRPGLPLTKRTTPLCVDVGALVARPASAKPIWAAIVASQPRQKRQALGAPPYGGSDPAAPTFSATTAPDDAELFRLPDLDDSYFTPDPPSITSGIASKNQEDRTPRQWRDDVMAINKDRMLALKRVPPWWKALSP